MTWLHACGEGVRLTLHIQPGAKKTEIAGQHGDALKIRLAAPPVDGKANEALVAFLAARLGIAKRCIVLVSGEASRRKQILLHGVSAAAAAGKLGMASTSASPAPSPAHRKY